jgi:hypothetical protein
LVHYIIIFICLGLTKSKPDTSTTNNNIKQKVSKNLQSSPEQLSPTAPALAVHTTQPAVQLHPDTDNESLQPAVKKRRLQALLSVPQHKQQLQLEEVSNGDENKSKGLKLYNLSCIYIFNS